MTKLSTQEAIIEKGMASYPAIYLVTEEEVRALGEIQAAAKSLKRKFFIWTFGKGLMEEVDGSRVEPTPLADTESPPAVMDFLIRQGKKTMDQIIVLKNFHHFLKGDPLVQAKLLQLIPIFKQQQRMLVITAPTIELPTELQKEIALQEMSLPSKEDLDLVLESIIDGVGHAKNPIAPPSKEVRERILENAMGLTTQEAENAFALCVIRPKRQGNPRWDPNVVMEEKCAALKKSGLLTFYPPTEQGMKQIGGLSGLKEWVSMRKGAFTKAAADFGLEAPKGILTVGPPGSGKSLSAKAISEELGLPLLRCDMGRIYAGIVGASEMNVRSVIQTAEAVAPCVLWFDEIEKGMAGAKGGGLDSGVGSRVLGTILTWMSEKTTPVFVYATANDVSQLPPELLRKGRFDEVFSVGLPNKAERKEILELHITKRGRGKLLGHFGEGEINRTTPIDLDFFAKKTDGWSGAEIEGAVKEAMFTAFAAGKDLNAFDFNNALDSTKPLSQIMKAEIEATAQWCRDRTRPANSPEVVEGKVTITKPGRNMMS